MSEMYDVNEAIGLHKRKLWSLKVWLANSQTNRRAIEQQLEDFDAKVAAAPSELAKLEAHVAKLEARAAELREDQAKRQAAKITVPKVNRQAKVAELLDRIAKGDSAAIDEMIKLASQD